MENKPKRLVKNSEEAKEYMKALRAKRGNKKPIVETPIETPIEITPNEITPTPQATPKRKNKKINVEFS